MKVLPVILLLSLLFLTGIAGAKTITLNPDGGHSNQNQINEALEIGNVYLEAGVYEVDDTIIIGSNRLLTGDKNAIIKVWSGSSQYFIGSKGVISCTGVVKDVEISNIQIDGNIANLPKSYADSRSDTDHDCEKLIILRGSSNNLAKNIRIHDMKLYNSFSDGIYIIYAENVYCYRNFISNCQHEGIYLSCVINFLFRDNKIAGITSDCGRMDNCAEGKVCDNLFFSYNGESYGAYKNGHCGLQIADAGSSHGYNAAKVGWHTKNIEVYNNTFADPGRKAIWLDSTGKGVTNVYIHDNEFIDAAGLETQGIPVGDISSNVSYDNPPAVETSENIFSSIFDFLNMQVYTQVGENDTVILPDRVKESPIKATGMIEFYEMGNSTYTLISVPLDGLSEVQYEVNGIEETHTVMIGEYTKNGVLFTETDIWDGELPHEGNALKLSGKVDPSDIKVKCITPKGEFEPDFKTATVEFKPLKIHPAVILIFIAILIFIMFIRTSLKHML